MVTAVTHPEDAGAARRRLARPHVLAPNLHPLVAPRPGDDRQ